MIGNHKLSWSDYVEIFRLRVVLILVATVVFSLAGYLLSYISSGRNSSASLVAPRAAEGGPITSVSNPELLEAKRTLDDRSAKLEAFKRLHSDLPAHDRDATGQVALKSRLDASRRAEVRAREDRAYTQSLLDQQLSGRTGDARLSAASKKSGSTEPIEIRQLRVQIREFDDQIASATREQKQVLKQLDSRQEHSQLDPDSQQLYAQLTQDYEVAQKSYSILLARTSTPGGGSAEYQAPPESSSDDPSGLPNRRPWFVGSGVAGGLAVGIGLALWLELRSRNLRTRQDAEAALQAPVLVSVPWVGSRTSSRSMQNSPGQINADGNGKQEKVTIEV